MRQLARQQKIIGLITLLFLLIATPAILVATKTETNLQSQASGQLIEDINADGHVNLDDVKVIREVIENDNYRKQADLYQDGTVNSLDIDAFYRAYSLQ